MAPKSVTTKEEWDSDSALTIYPTVAVYQCDGCNRFVLCYADLGSYPGVKPSGVFEVLDEILIQEPGLLNWLPRKGESREFDDVPGEIASAASEAYECFSIGAYRAALSLSRAVVEATAKHLGIVDGKLYAKINEMVTRGHLRRHTGDVAHEIRHWGNDMAHGDFASPISHDEAEGVLELMGEVLQEVFQGPARLRRVQQLRQAPAGGTA